ncbi:hypothetical protein EOE18_08345 [Novosphingobium umbonatum]|uniref:Uncharacterized protein n=1 Tax=Novosphingobium umbonatum TaxID=1908524 RepID=A0A437N5V9_9SPHN|nr:hypothetical protein [Novosphingobium umbonatum]RVU05316.1 hypothetical protein EOE18_08345 [Novosphingobium umbonatum]
MTSIAMAASLLAASLVAPHDSHSLTLSLPHGGEKAARAPLVYSVTPQITMRTAGVHAPNRADLRHCVWEGRWVVTRKLGHEAHPARKIQEGPLVTGREHGACPAQAAAIKREALARLGDPARLLQQVAEGDHAMTMAEAEAHQTGRKTGG